MMFRRPPRSRHLVNTFAERLAEGDNAKAAAAYCGVSEQTGYNILRQIKAELGWQASA
jgi:transposase